MIEENFEHGWRQHFPTYDFKERDIALEEYKTATKSLEAEERVFLNASNIAVLASAGLGSLAVGTLDQLTEKFTSAVPAVLTLSVLLFLITGFSWVSLRYFADRQKSVVFSARKVIVLRRMLGLSYGTLQLVLPNWRIEGADEPFSVRLFPGWNTYVTYPYYALAGISSVVVFFLLASLATYPNIPNQIGVLPIWSIIIAASFSWAFFLAYVYRKALLDAHEKTSLLLVRNLASTIRLRVVGNFEYIIYRATLARYENNRHQLKQDNLKRMLVFIEDRNFYSHSGVSIKALMRVLLGFLKLKRRSGGSTITQQVVRTLFIKDQSKIIRRKIVEIILAKWLDSVFSKEVQLELYLASVRFERGIYGVVDAMQFYWGRLIQAPSKAEAFFLIERVSNIYSLLLTDKIIHTIRSAKGAEMLDEADTNELIELYRGSIENGKIKDPNHGIKQLESCFMPTK